jgi:hypothetical protein
MVDLVEARRDVAFQHPLIGAGAEVVDLGDRVLARRPGRNPYEQGWKSTSRIGSSTSFRAAACTTRSPTVGMPSRRRLPPGLGSSAPAPAGAQTSGPSGRPEARRGRRPRPARAGRSRPSGHPPQPSGRPPGLPVPWLRTRCRPSPCGRLSRPPTTTAAPPPPQTLSRRRPCPPPTWPAGGQGNLGRVPTFTADRLTRAVPSFPPAALPRVRRRPSPWASTNSGSPCWWSRPPANRAVACCCPAHIHQVGAGVVGLRGFHHWFTARCTFSSC